MINQNSLSADCCKEIFLARLPFTTDGFNIRELRREDLDLYALWPDYPPPYDMFNTSLKTKPISERDRRWDNYSSSNKGLSLVMDHEDKKMIGKYSFGINWSEMIVTNMGIRLHPEWCDKGVGSKLLKAVSDWCFSNGIKSIKFDVLSTNQRAVNAYKKVGYKITDQFTLDNALFYWMELKKK